MNAQEKINEIRTFARELAQVVGRNEMMAHVALAKIHDKVNEIAGHELAAHHLDAHGREEFANREREARAQFETFGTSEMWKIAHANRKALGDEFVDWLPRNVHVWRAFERHALTLIKRGRNHYSSKTIVHVLRHESAIAEHGGMERSKDRRRTTHHIHQSRTADCWITPYNTGWHLAHHTDMGVPWRNLPRYHAELEAAGWITPEITYPSYRAFWKAASTG